jgi:hypothetical protein
MQASIVATSPGARLAQASTETDATGLRVCAIAEELPRGRAGSGSPSRTGGEERVTSRATCAATAGSRVPTGPPIWTASGTRRSSQIASSIAVIQPAAFSPKEVGNAGCSRVSPSSGVSRCRRASKPAASAAAPAST